MDYKEINSELVVKTIERLEERISDRFPKSGLRQVCAQLASVARNAQKRSEWISRPVRWLRWLIFLICLAVILVSFGSIYLIFGNVNPEAMTEVANEDFRKLGLTEAIQVLEAALNDIVLIGAALFFLLSLETRYKRTRALKAIHELRSIAHIIDMHQLTKDPHRLKKTRFIHSAKSPKLEMTPFLLRRYLDYCSEMLSLTGKIGALYVQKFDDGVALASASELESLTTGLSGKIWQKILTLNDSAVEEDESNSSIISPS